MNAARPGALSRAATGGYRGPTYHGQPMLKPSKYDWPIWGYTWIAGVAGSAQVLAGLADLLGHPGWRGVVRQGRVMAAFLPVVGTGLLVADLHTPQRFHHMLRIFRATSPMSIGSYVLSGFGLASAVCALADVSGRPRLARAAQVPAVLSGAGMSVYTASLLSATSVPLWSATPRLLAGRFAASALATGAAGLSLGQALRGRTQASIPLDRVAVMAALVEFGFETASERRWRALGMDDALQRPDIAAARRTGTWLGVALPLACWALNELAPRRSATLSAVGAVGLLAGGLFMRAAVFRAGNASAERAEHAFTMARLEP